MAPAPTVESCLEDSSWDCSRAPSFRGLNSDPHSFSMNWVCLKARVRTAVGSSVRAGDREVRGVAGGLASLQVRIAKLNRSVPAEMQVSGPRRGWRGSQRRGQPRNKEVLERGCRPEFQPPLQPLRATQENHTSTGAPMLGRSLVWGMRGISGILDPQEWSPARVLYLCCSERLSLAACLQRPVSVWCHIPWKVHACQTQDYPKLPQCLPPRVPLQPYYIVPDLILTLLSALPESFHNMLFLSDLFHR